MGAADAGGRELAVRALPIGLAQGVTLQEAVQAGQVLRVSDVVLDEAQEAVRVRRDLERIFGAADGEGSRGR